MCRVFWQKSLKLDGTKKQYFMLSSMSSVSSFKDPALNGDSKTWNPGFGYPNSSLIFYVVAEFCRAPFPCVVKMLKCFYYLNSSSSFLFFFQFHKSISYACQLSYARSNFYFMKKNSFFNRVIGSRELCMNLLKVTVDEILGLL